jgi:hypothetical protein
MNFFSFPENLHKPPSRPKNIHEYGGYGSYGTSNLSKKIHPNALVKRIEKIKRLLLRFNGHVALGKAGEILLQAELQAQGWHRVKLTFEKYQGDLTGVHPETGEIIRFEVKTAKRGGKLGRWEYCLNKDKHTAVNHADYLYLLAIDEHGAIYRYLVPSCFFANVAQFTLSSHPTSYRGKLAAFRLRSETIDIYQAQEIYQLGVRP